MPLVFVHGVTVRSGLDYAREVKDRDALFQTIVLCDAQGVPYAKALRNPYWGGLAANFRWSQASVPKGKYAALGAADPLIAAILTESPRAEGGAGNEAVLSDVARAWLPAAVDLLVAASLDSAGNSGREPISRFARGGGLRRAVPPARLGGRGPVERRLRGKAREGG